MAAVASALQVSASACVSAKAAPVKSQRVRSLASFSGLKASPVGLSQAKSVEEQFAVVAASCKASSRGGALTSSCNVGAEILSVIPVMGAMVLVGITLGFVLLRVEAAVEESE